MTCCAACANASRRAGNITGKCRQCRAGDASGTVQQGGEAGGAAAAAAVCTAYGAGAAAPLCASIGKYVGKEAAKIVTGIADDIAGVFGGGSSISCSGPGCAAASAEQTVLLVPTDVAVALNTLILSQFAAAHLDPAAKVASASTTAERTARSAAYIIAAGHVFLSAPPVDVAKALWPLSSDQLAAATAGIDTLVNTTTNPQGQWFVTPDSRYSAGSIRNALLSASITNGGNTALGNFWTPTLAKIQTANQTPATQRSSWASGAKDELAANRTTGKALAIGGAAGVALLAGAAVVTRAVTGRWIPWV